MRQVKKSTADYEIQAREELKASIDMEASGFMNVLEEFDVYDIRELNTIPFSKLKEIAKRFDALSLILK